MTQSMLRCFLSGSHTCLAVKRNMPFRQDFICIQARVHAFAQPATLPSRQNCRCKRTGGVRPSCCRLIAVSLLDHSDVTGHTELCCFGQEKSSRELLAGCYLHTFLLLFLFLTYCPSPLPILSLPSGCCFFPRKSLDMSPGTSLQS